MLRIYTTRPDTLFGATYMVIAPEHPFVGRLTKPAQAAAVEAYCRQAAAKSDLDRTDLAKEKTGVFTGSYAVNPVNGKATPIWVADYVLSTYGTGAIMAVPAHDTRDFEFAQEFGLPIVPVVDPGEAAGPVREQLLAGQVAFIADGTASTAAASPGLPTAEFKRQIIDDLANTGPGPRGGQLSAARLALQPPALLGRAVPDPPRAGRRRASPTGLVRALSPEELPLNLPEKMAVRRPARHARAAAGQGPGGLALPTIDGRRYKRETNTMPQWAGSCWYYLRFLDPQNDQALVDPEVEKAWMPVDLYVGGAEHAVLHLLYARFWHKVLYDRGYVSTPEPFRKLVNQGMILGENGEKMSKSRGNVVNPDEVVADYGADSLRLYEMFMGPLEAVKPWSMDGVSGVARVSRSRLADDGRRSGRGDAAQRGGGRHRANARAEPRAPQDDPGRDAATSGSCRSTRPSPG